jgi:dihydrofolate reductase
MLGRSFLRLGLVDEIRLMIAPVILGDGLHLFGDSGTEQKWHLKNVSLIRTVLSSYRTGANQPTPSLKAVTSRRAPLIRRPEKVRKALALEETSC